MQSANWLGEVQSANWSRVGVGESGYLGPGQTLGEGLPDKQMGWEGEGVSGKASGSRLLIGSRRFSFKDFESVEKKIIRGMKLVAASGKLSQSTPPTHSQAQL